MEVGDAFGAQTWAAKLIVDFTSPLKVVARISLVAPQVEPAVAFRMATFLRAFSATALQ